VRGTTILEAKSGFGFTEAAEIKVEAVPSPALRSFTRLGLRITNRRINIWNGSVLTGSP
jgi:hypothetical protein